MAKSPLPAASALSLALALPVLLAGCIGGDEGESYGKKVPSSMTWMSTTLSGSAAKAKASAGNVPPMTVDTSDFYLSYRVTPSNMEGRLIQASLMVGQAGPGGGSALRLVGDERGFNDRVVARSDELPLFNMADKLTMDSDFRCCWETYPDDDRAYSGWFEIMFAYVDVTFQIHSGRLSGSHTVRTAFAEIGDLGYGRGDLLYKTDGGFQWVDQATGKLAPSRPPQPIRLDWVANFGGSGDGRGNQHIPALMVAVQDSQKVHMPADTVLANAWEFVADFILRNGLIFRRVDPDTMTSVAQLLSAFDIRADRDNASSGSDGISSNFYAIKTPLEMPRPNDFKDSLGNWILPPPPDSSDEEP
jgi:hypothetical protein